MNKLLTKNRQTKPNQAANQQHRRDSGFTIVEIMVATVVFSIILLVITAGIIRFTASYYKGVNVSATQAAARSLIDEISQSIQYGKNVTASTVNPSTGLGFFCVDNKRYSYVIGYQVLDSGTLAAQQSRHALVVDNPTTDCLTGQNVRSTLPAPTGQELIGQKMRLSDLSVQPVAGSSKLYQVKVKIVYGDTDLLCNNPPSPAAGNCSSPPSTPLNWTAGTAAGAPSLACRSGSGSQFCATAALETVVEKRYNP
jgi:prepilin-type N-terminal cleavage/methylation domain-containing protein